MTIFLDGRPALDNKTKSREIETSSQLAIGQTRDEPPLIYLFISIHEYR